MSEFKRPLKRSMFIGCSVFIVLLCLILSILTYRTYTQSLYNSYNERMTDIINYVYAHIDVEDLSECVKTGNESEKYQTLRIFMDDIMEDFDIHYLYIVYPLSKEPPHMLNILTADTAWGRENEPDGYYLNYVIDDAYKPEDIQHYMTALAQDDIYFFKNFSTWGYDYTASKGLIDSTGNKYGLLCVDIEVSEVERAIRVYTITNIVLIVILGVFFITLFLIWMTRNITDPISRLERSVVSFAKISHQQKDPEKLSYTPPSIHTQNEVESLSNAVAQMSMDMKVYVKNILDAEDKVKDMRSQVSRMDMLAYQDALTHVKNKAWYDKTKERVDGDIAANRARFGIVMADLNHLKKINDNYGHEHGNDYIFGSCHQICVIYDHSPVFRIGGDEFVVLLENRDYDNRDELFERLKTSFDLSSNSEDKEPWERYSAAYGMAIFDPKTDKSMDDVFKRADSYMYKHKMETKSGRE